MYRLGIRGHGAKPCRSGHQSAAPVVRPQRVMARASALQASSVVQVRAVRSAASAASSSSRWPRLASIGTA